MIGAAWIERVMREDVGAGGYVSFHSSDPGGNGAALIGTAYPVGPSVLRSTGRTTTNVQRIHIPAATASGLATHFGIWTRRREWVAGGPLRVTGTIRQGQPIAVEPGDITVVFE